MGQANIYGYGAGAVSVYGGGDPSSVLQGGGSGTHLMMGGGMEYEAEVPVAPEPNRCHHRKDDGDFCGRFPKRGDEFCPIHKVDDSES
jgi:hypothetical protein